MNDVFLHTPDPAFVSARPIIGADDYRLLLFGSSQTGMSHGGRDRQQRDRVHRRGQCDHDQRRGRPDPEGRQAGDLIPGPAGPCVPPA
jgi:hypothetical protein